MQCRWLAISVKTFDSEEKPVIKEAGKLVITKPIPSMPIYFWGDENYKWYKESYFSLFPNVWWHGDWIMITDRGTAIIYGRSDSTIKRKGVRMGTLDIVFFIISATGAKRELNLVLVMGSCWAERAKDLKKGDKEANQQEAQGFKRDKS